MSRYQRWKGILKAYPFEEKRLSKWNPPFIVQPKYDGIRCRAVPINTGPKGDEYILLSSEENIIYSVPHLNETFRHLHLRAELDGELYCHGMSFEDIVSITSRTVNLHPDYTKIQFHCFDIINQEPQMRRTILIDALRGLSPYIQIAPFWLCENLDDIMRVYDKLIKMDYEGIIVRHFQAPYERKRSTFVMKFKAKKEDVYEILGWNEEVSITGQPKDRLGSLVCASGDGNTFQVGTGFSDEDRESLWKNIQSLKGKVVKVQYQHLTTGKGVPRFPVFVEVVENE